MICEVVVIGAFALATLRRCSVVMILSFLCNGVFSEMTSPTGVVSYDPSDSARSEPWRTPCGHVMPEALKNATARTEIKDILKNVQLQLQSANAKYYADSSAVRHVYRQVCRVLGSKRHYKMTWLPRNQWSWYKNKIACLDDKRKAKLMLPRLHKTMQLYAITFHQLLHFRLNSAHSSTTNFSLLRNEIVNRTHIWSRIVLCEVETSVETLGLRVAVSLNESIVTEHYQNKGDLTQMLIQDWGIFTFYESFLKEWLKAFNDATAKGPGLSRYCTPEKKLNSKIRNKPAKDKGMMKKLCPDTKYVLTTILNQNTSLPSLLEDRQKESFRKRFLKKRPMGKNILKKRLPKNILMRNKRKKLQKLIC